MDVLPLVSILIPTYNQPEFFRQALESALSQDYPNIEVVVSDDSTDARVKNVFDGYKNCGRILRYFEHRNYLDSDWIGDKIVANMENLLSKARGEYVNILFHDDLIYPKKISTMMKVFMSSVEDQVSIVSSARHLIDEDGKIIRELNSINLNRNTGVATIYAEEVGRLIFFTGTNFIGELSTVLMRRKDFYRNCVGRLSPGYLFGVKDRTMWDISTYFEACQDERNLVFIHEPLSAFRLAGGDQNTYNWNIRLSALMDWLSFATASYLLDCYIHDSEDFMVFLDRWAKNVRINLSGIHSDWEDRLSINVIEKIVAALEAMQAYDFNAALSVGIEWIRLYSSETFEVEKYAVQDSHGIWIRKRDLI
ncbi:MAG: glycosyltransferase [Selenomonadaceae bacterium]|nr:glycosyltransferase [Selenomonadaceae bacterium]